MPATTAATRRTLTPAWPWPHGAAGAWSCSTSACTAGRFRGLLAIEQSLADLAAGGPLRNTGVGAFYAVFDAAVAVVMAAQGWSLARLARRHVPAQGPRWAVPLLREFTVPAAIAVLPRTAFKVNWKGLFLYGPDMSYALAGIGGLAALAGLLRIAKATRSLPGWPPARQMPGTTSHRSNPRH